MLIAYLNMIRFVFFSPQMSLFSEFAFCEFKFWRPKVCVPFLSAGPTFTDGVLHIMNFGAHIVHFFRLKTWFYANSLFKYDSFCICLVPKWVCFLNLALASSNFWRPNNWCAISISTGHFYLMVYCILRILVPL